MQEIKFQGYGILGQNYLSEGVPSKVFIQVSDDQLEKITPILQKKCAQGLFEITIKKIEDNQ